MPKDRTENIDRYKIRGGHLNEFEFQQNEGAMAEQERERFLRREQQEGLRGEAEPHAPQTEAERVAQMMEDARAKAEKIRRKKGKLQAKQSAVGAARRTRKKGGKSSAKGRGSGKARAGGKKSAAKKGASGKKGAAGGAKRGATKKAGAKKTGAKRASTKRPAGKRSSAKKSSAKRSAGSASKGGARKRARAR